MQQAQLIDADETSMGIILIALSMGAYALVNCA